MDSRVALGRHALCRKILMIFLKILLLNGGALAYRRACSAHTPSVSLGRIALY
ncbi:MULTISPECIES: hypothetical protein [Helicobacter]|uniref:Uncharacterized protein n=1 Tax=Helicobacter zhangjianzhongii TaxID=2974574 RepID=A0ACC6FU28_9HELI|nr:MULTISPECIES: hypothetical protein [Helicobacter]MDL0080593.1 hypothetical protein [Helicobacter sp. CPD2-1]MDL0082766.1 hypothetical protein [Helicobacter sp. XJK30-2]